jgi:uncharacterized protein involved in exopolysaccharide biosynthesis
VESEVTVLKRVAGIAISGLLGAAVGCGAGHFVYQRSPQVFESSAVVQIAHTPPAADGPGDETRVAPSTRSTDATWLLLSDQVLLRAVELGQLDQLPELSGGQGGPVEQPNPSAAFALRTGDRLSVQRLPPTIDGEVYEIRCRGATADSSQQVLSAVVASGQQWIAQNRISDGWRQSMELLREADEKVTTRLRELEQQLRELPRADDGAIIDKAVVSAAAERLYRLRNQANAMQSERTQLESDLRLAETLIAEGASAASILESLGQPVDRPAAGPNEATASIDSPPPAMTRQEALARREQLAREVEKELEPLQRELDRLLKNLGTEHPTVRGVRAEMQKARAKLDGLPPLDPEPVSTAPAAATTAAKPAVPGDSAAAQQIALQLRVLRSEKRRLDEQFAALAGEVDHAATETAKQEAILREQLRIAGEIAQQQVLLEQIANRLDKLNSAEAIPRVDVTVLRSAGAGIQVEPRWETTLAMGGLAGLLCGGAVGGLLRIGRKP